MTISLAQELDTIATDFKSRKADIGVSEINETGAFIGILAMLAQRMERELSIFRDMEADGQARRSMEQAAIDHLEDMVADAKGKIIRPEFGKGGRS